MCIFLLTQSDLLLIILNVINFEDFTSDFYEHIFWNWTLCELRIILFVGVNFGGIQDIDFFGW